MKVYSDGRELRVVQTMIEKLDSGLQAFKS